MQRQKSLQTIKKGRWPRPISLSVHQRRLLHMAAAGRGSAEPSAEPSTNSLRLDADDMRLRPQQGVRRAACGLSTRPMDSMVEESGPHTKSPSRPTSARVRSMDTSPAARSEAQLPSQACLTHGGTSPGRAKRVVYSGHCLPFRLSALRLVFRCGFLVTLHVSARSFCERREVSPV